MNSIMEIQLSFYIFFTSKGVIVMKKRKLLSESRVIRASDGSQ